MNSHPATPVVESAKDGPRLLLARLREQFHVFRDFLPLAIGIDRQVLAALPEIRRKDLRVALGMHTHSLRYLKALAKAVVRVDLEGHAAGEITAEQRAHAAGLIRERQRQHAEQRQAEKLAQQRARKLDQLVEKFGRSR